MTPMEEDGIENMEEQDGGLGMAAPLEFARSLVTSGKFDPEAAKKAAGEAASGLAKRRVSSRCRHGNLGLGWHGIGDGYWRVEPSHPGERVHRVRCG